MFEGRIAISQFLKDPQEALDITRGVMAHSLAFGEILRMEMGTEIFLEINPFHFQS